MFISPFLIPIVALIAVPVTAIGIPIARAYARRMERGPMGPQMPTEMTARLERMEQALDSIAIEVERISEAQRFTTKLLSDKSKSTDMAGPTS